MGLRKAGLAAGSGMKQAVGTGVQVRVKDDP